MILGGRVRCQWIGLCIVVCTSLNASVQGAVAVTKQIIVQTGDLLPGGGGSFNTFGWAGGGVVLNDVGQIAFRASIAGATTATNEGIYRRDGTIIREIAREGQAFPGSISTFSGFEEVLLNNAGQVAFLSNSTRLFRTNGTSLVGVGTTNIGVFSLNAVGQVSSYTTTTGNNVIRRSNGQTTTIIAQSGQVAPGGTASFFSVSAADLTNTGSVIFTGIVTNNHRVYVGNGVAITEVVREGDATPLNDGQYDTFRGERMNESGRIVIAADYRGVVGSNNAWGIITIDPNGNTHELVRGPTPAPGGGIIQYEGSLDLNESGLFAFSGNTIPGSLTFDSIFICDNGNLRAVVRKGQPTPDPSRVFYALDQEETYALNDEGDVAFQATTRIGNGSSARGLYYFDDVWGMLEIARVGDPLLGSTISSIVFNRSAGVGDTEASGLNNHNQVAYIAELADNREVVVLATIPEPGALSFLAVLALLLVRGHAAPAKDGIRN